MADIKTKLNVGDTVWWVHCSNKIYKGTVKEILCCDYQGHENRIKIKRTEKSALFF